MENNLISKKILDYKDILAAKVGTSREPLVVANQFDNDIIMDSWDSFRGDILVRETVAKKLAKINAKLKTDKLNLKVEFGFRPLKIQQKFFEREKTKLAADNPGKSDEELNEMTHVFFAVPDIAGHPTGGAVDVTITDTNNFLQ